MRASTLLVVCVCAERAARREQKKAKQAKKALGEDAASEWVAIDEWFIAKADDGRGHHDGDGKYTVHIPIEDFGAHFYPGGEVRLDMTGGVHEQIYRLPTARPPSGAYVALHVQALPAWALGSIVVGTGFQVRRACV